METENVRGSDLDLDECTSASGEFAIVRPSTQTEVAEDIGAQDLPHVRNALFRRFIEDWFTQRLDVRSEAFMLFLENGDVTKGIDKLFDQQELFELSDAFMCLQRSGRLKQLPLMNRRDGRGNMSEVFRVELGLWRHSCRSGAIGRQANRRILVLRPFQRTLYFAYEEVIRQLGKRMIRWDDLREFLHAPPHKLDERLRRLGTSQALYDLIQLRLQERQLDVLRLAGVNPLPSRSELVIPLKLFIDELRWKLWFSSVAGPCREAFDLARRLSGLREVVVDAAE